MFKLDWLENPEPRQRCYAALNDSEQRHVLNQAIYTLHQWPIIDRSHEAQQDQAFGLNLIIAAIVYLNATYMDEAVEHLRQAGEMVPVDLSTHTSPIGWEHIAFSGDFLWERAAAASGRKSLILPAQTRTA